MGKPFGRCLAETTLRKKCPSATRQPASLNERRLMVFAGPRSFPFSCLYIFAVGTFIAERPPHRSERAQFGHSAPTLGGLRQALRLSVRGPAPVTCQPGSVSGACFADPRSPWSQALAPPAPPPAARLCSSASQLLWRSQTSRARASSATAPRLSDADQSGSPLLVGRRISQVPTRSLRA